MSCRAVLLFLVVVSTARLLSQTEGDADCVVLGPIITMDSARPTASGLVIRRGLIAEVTDLATAQSRIGPSTRIIHVPANGAAMPGIIDSHAHLLGVGQARRTLDLRTATSVADVQALVAAAAQVAPAGTWIFGRGFNQERWLEATWPSRTDLDQVCSSHPVCLVRVDGHALWANSQALSLAGITSNSPTPPGGAILRDTAGSPSGILLDAAMDMVTRLLPKDEDPSLREQDYLAAQEEALSFGITTFVDAGTSAADLRILNELYAKGHMKLRVYSMLSVQNDRDLSLLKASAPIKSFHNGRVAVRAWKLYQDGALGSRGAWLLTPYEDRPGETGFPVLEPAFIQRAASQALAQGYQIAVHAIGDRGTREALSAIEKALEGATPAQRADHRFRIEHAQIVHPEDVRRFRKLGVIPSMQGCHCTSDGPWVPARLGAARAKERAYVWRSFLDEGLIIPNGTDAPVESLSPWWNFYSSITRFMDTEAGPVAFGPEQRMNRQEALLSMTSWGAHGIFAESERGLLRPGMKADFIVINRNPMTASAWHVGRTSVLQTFIEGEPVWSKSP
jgi:predicted amidohydrolase YtcJ